MELENLKAQLKEMQYLNLLDREKLANLFQEGIIDESDKPINKYDEADMR